MESKTIWLNSLKEAQKTVSTFLEDAKNIEALGKLTDLFVDTYRKGGRVFSCGNGGSHCDAMHFAEELTGRYRQERKPLGALALGDPSHLTCVGNDYGFDHVFSRQLTGLARPGDLLLLISTSGNSPNLLKAAEAAKSIPIRSVAFLGRDGGKLRTMVDHYIIAPGESSDRIQEIHIKVIHILIETIERQLFPENYR